MVIQDEVSMDAELRLDCISQGRERRTRIGGGVEELRGNKDKAHDSSPDRTLVAAMWRGNYCECAKPGARSTAGKAAQRLAWAESAFAVVVIKGTQIARFHALMRQTRQADDDTTMCVA